MLEQVQELGEKRAGPIGILNSVACEIELRQTNQGQGNRPLVIV
jgi:hypothetical protein